ncbi:MAG: Uma2 family endonuclease [Candidatus Paceibacterota bacterium]
MVSTPTEWTIAELSEQFGPVPLARIRTTPPPGQATEHDVVEIEAREKRLYELYNGVLMEKVMGYYESYLAMLLGRFLAAYVDEHDLGIVAGEAGMLQLLAGEIRIPDVSFVSWDRLPGRRIPREPVPRLVPELAVEVVSKSNTSKEMERKLREYFAAGTRLVWYVYPDTRTVRVFTAPDQSVELNASQMLGGGDVLPGFQLPLTQLFREPPQDPYDE